MTRGLYPPESLTKEDVHALRNVRRDLYKNGLLGGGLGLCSGLVFHTSLQWARKLGFVSKKSITLNRNTAMLSVLGGGALGMFLLASQTGKEQVHLLHDVFRVGATPPTNSDAPLTYRQKMALDAQQSDHEWQDEQQRQTLDEQEKHQDSSANTRKRMDQVRMARRKSLMNGLEKGHGLSDSHGGQWYRDDDDHDTPIDSERLQAVRAVRRHSLMNSFQKGGSVRQRNDLAER